jgi:hypothetical protein
MKIGIVAFLLWLVPLNALANIWGGDGYKR